MRDVGSEGGLRRTGLELAAWGSGLVAAALLFLRLAGAGEAGTRGSSAPSAVAAGAGSAVDAPAASPPDAAAPQPFALVELYTSEGCSSCPPADRLLSELLTEARRDGTRAYLLAFHVDYWNGLGWTDRWSDSAYTERQSIYAGPLESRYTPQMVVNGVEKFVGSDPTRARRSVEAALATPAQVAVDARLAQAPGAGSRLAVLWRVTPVPRHGELHVALVERGLSSRVTRGENRGRTLEHDNVVRTFHTIALPADGTGETSIEPPPDARLDRASLVVFVQDAASHRVLGAAGFDMPPIPPATP